MENRWLFFNDFKNTKLKGINGDNAGSIHDVVLDLQTGRIVFYTQDWGGFLGAGSKKAALPPDALQFDEQYVNLLPDENSIENAPGTRTDWPEHFDSQFIDDVYRHYGYKPLSEG